LDDQNLVVNAPGGRWVKLDPAETGSRACLLMRRGDPTIVISLAAEPVGIEAHSTNGSLLAVSQAKMKSLPQGTVLPRERKLATHGIQGIAYLANSVTSDGTKVHYSIWVATRNGYNYSLAVYGEEKYKSYIDSTMYNFLRSIRPIDPHRIARAGDNLDVAHNQQDRPR
jgi:hypothetical protein